MLDVECTIVTLSLTGAEVTDYASKCDGKKHNKKHSYRTFHLLTAIHIHLQTVEKCFTFHFNLTLELLNKI